MRPSLILTAAALAGAACSPSPEAGADPTATEAAPGVPASPSGSAPVVAATEAAAAAPAKRASTSQPSTPPTAPTVEAPVMQGAPADPERPVGPAVGPGKDLNGDGRITEDERPHY